MRDIIARLDSANYDIVVQIASIPEATFGYGYVKRRHLKEARAHEAELLAAFGAAREVVAAV